MRIQVPGLVGTTASLDRPAFYALRPGAWRDYLTLLHPPYTLWHLSYVVLGVALAPTLHYGRLGATLLAFFLAVGLSAHAFDEIAGRPLRTRIPGSVLYALAFVGLAGAMTLGVVGALLVSPLLIAFIVVGAFAVPAYSLEWFQGRFHSDLWFALAWGAFPFLTAYWISAQRFGLSAGFGTLAVVLLSLAQRNLSLRVRAVRRRARLIEGCVTYADGLREDIDSSWLVSADERALTFLSPMVAVLSIAVLLARS